MAVDTEEKTHSRFEKYNVGDGEPISIPEKIYIAIYESCYMMGIYLIRRWRGVVYAIMRFFTHLGEDISTGTRRLAYHIAFPFHEWMIQQREQIRSIRRERTKYTDIVKNARYQGAGVTIMAALRLAGIFLLVIWRVILRILNYAAPIAACVLFSYALNYFTGLDYALNVEYAGENIGYIRDETVFHNAEQIIRNRTVIGDTDISEIIPSYKLVVVNNEELTDPNDLADKMFRASGSDVVDANGLYINGDFVGATESTDNLLLVLDDIREQYRGDDADARLSFVQSISITDGLYPSSSVLSSAEFHTLLSSEVEGEQYYTVVAGDAPSLIASEFGIPYADFLAMNPGVEESLLVGDKVLISRSVPYLSVTTTKREVYTEDIPFTTNYTYDNNYYSTYAKTTKAGVNGEQEVTALVTYLDGQPIQTQVLSTEVLKEPVPREVTSGTKNPINATNDLINSGSTGKGFIWPVPAGGYVSCGLWGYWGHTGMDITGTGFGSNICASSSGTVVTSGWGGAYGYYIIINHGGGVQTLYAHCSALYVRAGQYVNQGDIIAAMGASGNASGNHLHFEIRVNGQYMNPALYF